MYLPLLNYTLTIPTYCIVLTGQVFFLRIPGKNVTYRHLFSLLIVAAQIRAPYQPVVR